MEFGFKVCRVCLSPEDIAALSPLFEKSEINAKKLQIVAGLDVSQQTKFLLKL
jgi:hypothetical protein